MENSSESGEQPDEAFVDEPEIEYEEADLEESAEDVEVEMDEADEAEENAETESEEIPLFDDGISTYGMARGGGGSSADDYKTVTSVEVISAFDEDGYYPASLEYVLRNYFTIKVTYEDNSTEQISGWTPVSWNSVYAPQIGDYDCYASYGWYFMRFYDKDNNRVEITDTYVPIGEYRVEIGCYDGKILKDDLKLKILAPVYESVSGNTASFSSSQSDKYEESWFPVPSELTGNYIYNYVYNSSNLYSSHYFAAIWSFTDGVAQCVNEGIKEYYSTDVFEQELDGKNENLYLVIGEGYCAYDISGSITWQKEKEVSSISVDMASSYKAWNDDIEKNSSLTVFYADGSTEILGGWNSRYNRNADTYVYEVTSENNDRFLIGLLDSNGNLTECYTGNSWKAGTISCKAWMEEDESINTTASITVAEPNAIKLELEEGKQEQFNISKDNEAYYQFSVSDEAKKVELINDSTNEMYCYVYKRTSSTERWDFAMGLYIYGSDVRTYELEAGYEYLVILYTDKINEGTFGFYAEGTAKSASADSLTIKADDLLSWVTLPVTVTFVGEDGETVVGTQVIRSWEGDGTESGRAQTKYNENIWYALYKNGTRVSFPIFSEQMLTEIQHHRDNGWPESLMEDLKKNIAAAYGYDPETIKWTMDPGTYTVKIFKDSIADENQIGTTTVTVIGSECTDHKWDSGKVTKAATCTTAGVKTYTCTNSGCGKTKTETIPVTAHKYGSWTTTTQATVLAAAVQKRTCTVCKKTETRSYGSKLAAKAELPGGLKSLSVKKGKTVKFNLSMTAGDSIVSCTSANTKILKVSGVNKTTGAITLKAVKSGSANLNIKLKSNSSKTYTYKVKVTTGTVKTTKVSGIPSKQTLAKKGASFSLKPTLTPFTSTEKITYSSSNKKVATVTSSGKVKAATPGTAKITVKSGSKKAVCTVTVKGIGNVKTSLSLKKKKTSTLKPKLYGISGKVTYVSSNPKAATVNANGKITALKKGTTTITVKVGSYSCKCKVTVK